MNTIYLAGGCFWGVEHFFKGVDGVIETMPGYANGTLENPSYEAVYTDATGHAETVRVRYDEAKVSLQQILRYYFTIIDPLSLNRQGGDIGTRYRTGVFYADESERPIIEAAFAEAEQRIGQKIVTVLEPLRCFYPAEDYHRDYLDRHPGGYCHLPLKTFRYLRLYQDLKLFLGDEGDTVARMANAAALIRERMHFFWTGFYRVCGEQLVLGPFQGEAACMRIGYGKGVCGSAWKERRTLVVPDVEKFPGHIACSSRSRSEIVVPLLRSGQVTAVLDIDSDELGTFDAVDAAWLEMIAEPI